MENQKQKEDRARRNKEMVELYPNLTLMEIGKKYNLSKQRVKQIIDKVADQTDSGNNQIIKNIK